MHTMQQLIMKSARTIALAGAAATLLLPSRVEAANVLIVNPADPGAYAEIQEAVDAASPGDFIEVHPGNYSAVSITTEDLTIEGIDPAAKPQISGDDVAVQVFANGVTLRNLWARDSQAGFEVVGVTGVKLEANLATGMTVEFGAAFGLILSSHCMFVGNTATGNLASGFGFAGSHHNEIVNNHSDGNGLHGFNLSALRAANEPLGCWENDFAGNTAVGNGDAGFRFRFAHDNRFNGNTSERNDGNGFDLLTTVLQVAYPVSGNEFFGTKSRANKGWGIFQDADSAKNLFRGASLQANGLGASNTPLK